MKYSNTRGLVSAQTHIRRNKNRDPCYYIPNIQVLLSADSIMQRFFFRRVVKFIYWKTLSINMNYYFFLLKPARIPYN